VVGTSANENGAFVGENGLQMVEFSAWGLKKLGKSSNSMGIYGQSMVNNG
jgi:hypothetical protein